jgi:hypothetical protein
VTPSLPLPQPPLPPLHTRADLFGMGLVISRPEYQSGPHEEDEAADEGHSRAAFHLPHDAVKHRGQVHEEAGKPEDEVWCDDTKVVCVGSIPCGSLERFS